jgi:hypothetical protein
MDHVRNTHCSATEWRDGNLRGCLGGEYEGNQCLEGDQLRWNIQLSYWWGGGGGLRHIPLEWSSTFSGVQMAQVVEARF